MTTEIVNKLDSYLEQAMRSLTTKIPGDPSPPAVMNYLMRDASLKVCLRSEL